MKTLIHRFLSLLKSLFLKLSVILTLEIGKGKVNKDDNDRNYEESSGKDKIDENNDL